MNPFTTQTVHHTETFLNALKLHTARRVVYNYYLFKLTVKFQVVLSVALL